MSRQDSTNTSQNNNSIIYNDIVNKYQDDINNIMESGGTSKIQKQHNKGRLTARERIKYLIDND